MALHSDEVNLLVCRYLQESGFQHTAFMFTNESMLDESDFNSVDVPPQSLITILKKGMLYMQLEKGINERARSEDSADQIIGTIIDSVKRREPIQLPRIATRPKPSPPPPPPSQLPSEPISLSPDLAIVLRGHFSSVYCGSFSPDGRLLATGSADATAIIWELRDCQYSTHYILDHATKQERIGKDIPTLSWNPSGTILATGCYDGSARLWTSRGELKYVLLCHTQPVFAVEFSPDGGYLASGSLDGQVIVWNAASGQVMQSFSDIQSQVSDIDWLDCQFFAAASHDGKVYVFQVNTARAVLVLAGHTMDVTKVVWERSTKMLASCSDDGTVRVWRPFERVVAVVLQGHSKEVYTIGWPPEQQKLLVSASFDQTIRIWDVQARACVHVMMKHQAAIYTVAFSPRGLFFVSAGRDAEIFIWRVADGELVATFPTTGGVFEAVWSPSGRAIALCMTDATVVVIPTMELPIGEKF